MSKNEQSDGKLPPPEKEVRRDLWPTMTLQQLKNQQDLLLNKLGLMGTMMSPLAPPHIAQIYNALLQANDLLSSIIDKKSQR